MAPSATTTVVETANEPKTAGSTFFGSYKVLSSGKYSREVEEGKTGAKAAKVRAIGDGIAMPVVNH